jgi:hypothetical protein
MTWEFSDEADLYKVMFASDLKSFSTYGLPVHSSSPSTTVDETFDTLAGSPTKRKRPGTLTFNEVPKQISQPPSGHTDLIDTIKKRRRVIRVKYVF